MVSFNPDYDFGYEDVPEPAHVQVFRKLAQDWPEADRERMAAALGGPDFEANLRTLAVLLAGVIARFPALAEHVTRSPIGGYALQLSDLAPPLHRGIREVGPDGVAALLHEVLDSLRV